MKDTTSKKRRERERHEVRERIIEAARGLFAEQGYDAVTMRGIARKIDYTAAAIYFHFPGKEALLTEICARDFRALAAELGRGADVADPVEKLLRCGEIYTHFACTHPGMYRFMFLTLFPEVDLAKAGIRKDDPAEDAYAYLKGCVKECIDAGRFRDEYADPDLAAQTLWAGMHGLVSLYIVKGHEEWIEWVGLEKAVRTMSEILLRGMLREGTPDNG
jgi:AcrR family transcriptional regulator